MFLCLRIQLRMFIRQIYVKCTQALAPSASAQRSGDKANAAQMDLIQESACSLQKTNCVCTVIQAVSCSSK